MPAPIIEPTSATIFQGDWLQFSANESVTWSLSAAAITAGLVIPLFFDGSVSVNVPPSAPIGTISGALIATATVGGLQTTADVSIAIPSNPQNWAPNQVVITAQ